MDKLHKFLKDNLTIDTFSGKSTLLGVPLPASAVKVCEFKYIIVSVLPSPFTKTEAYESECEAKEFIISELLNNSEVVKEIGLLVKFYNFVQGK